MSAVIPSVGEDYQMSGSKRPVWLFVAVVIGLAIVAYLALRPQPSVRPTPAAIQPTTLVQVAPLAAKPTPSTSPSTGSEGASGQNAALPAPANVPADFGPQLLASTSGPEDWAMEGNNPSRTRSTNAQLALPLSQQSEVILTADTGSGSPLTIARGTMLVESEHMLRAFDLRDGSQRWSFPLRGIYVSPAVAGKYVFVRSESDNKGQMLALDIDSGKILWAFTPKRLSSKSNSYFGGHLTSPVVVDGTVFVGAGKEVYALDAANGAVRWEFAAKEYITSSATVADGRIYISDFEAIYAIDQKSGTQLWSYPTTMTLYFAPVIGGQTVLIASGQQLVALDTVSGQQRWITSLPGEGVIPSAVQGSRAFVKSTSTLYALDLASGKQLWQVHDTNYISLPAVAGDQVFVINGMGASTALLALDAGTGRNTWTLPVKSLATTAPVIAGQSLYVRTTDGRVLGFWH
jgi:outer membrane protein assembly factor BamB